VSTFVVGDIHGCLDSLKALLVEMSVDWQRDHVWLIGDLVGRGPDSLGVLRWARRHRERVRAVLGNHDLHLLAVSEGAAEARDSDAFDPILTASDRSELLDWLSTGRLAHCLEGYLLVHAGVFPGWSLDATLSLATEVEEVLQSDATRRRRFFREMYGDEPRVWNDNLPEIARHRFVVNALTRMRFLSDEGLDFGDTCAPEDAPPHLRPWFDAEPLVFDKTRVVFGHWSALGLRVSESWISLDSGCVWGDSLTGLALGGDEIFTVPCQEPGRSGPKG
jgi:bis(5'-nucleosyl)-tetraphosphatase (symmetrical)